MTVVSNTSPLLDLALIGRLALIEAQFDEVVIPTTVWHEIQAGAAGVDQIESLRDRGGLRIVSPESTELLTELQRELDAGEAAALAYAIDIRNFFIMISSVLYRRSK